MILDAKNLFASEQAVTATAVATNIVDLGKGDAGPSERLSLFVTAPVPFTGSGTLVVELKTADAQSAGALTNGITVATFPIANAQLLAGGKIVAARLPHGMKRYAGLNFAVTGTIAAGKLSAGLVWEVQAEEVLPGLV